MLEVALVRAPLSKKLFPVQRVEKKGQSGGQDFFCFLCVTVGGGRDLVSYLP